MSSFCCKRECTQLFDRCAFTDFTFNWFNCIFKASVGGARGLWQRPALGRLSSVGVVVGR
jgi:hypothetical protein